MNVEKKWERLAALYEEGEAITCLTAFDYPTGRIFSEAGIDAVLVGDSLGMVALGMPDTTGVTMADMIRHTRAVCRGVVDGGDGPLIVADLPYRSYESTKQAKRNSERLVAVGADAVKLEGGRAKLRQVRGILELGIPVIGHIGMLPQSIKTEGFYKKKGKWPEEITCLLDDAQVLAEAGVSGIVLESIVAEVAVEITALVHVPTIGVGAGTGCSGQVLVNTDVTGYFPWFVPSFAVTEARVAVEMRHAAERFISRVKMREPN